MKKFLFLACLFLCLGENDVFCENAEVKNKGTPTKEWLPESSSESSQSVTINGNDLHYKAVAGNILLKDEQQHCKASIFYVAYFKEDVPNPSKRPLIFCFNGGPGSSSVWLHMGAFGPRRVISNVNKNVTSFEIIPNEYSLLDLADLVFIDPVSTGYSCVAPGEDIKNYCGVDEDITSIGDFIRLFITKYERWESPKLLAGESYGTTRAAGLAKHLHNTQNIYLDGLILISSALNFQTIFDFDKGNDLPYPLFLPTYAATAYHHKKLSNQENQKTLDDLLKEVKEFAYTSYTIALMKGNTLAPEEKKRIVQKLVDYTGLTPEFIERSNLRINPYRFSMELLRPQNLVLGRFDSKIVGFALDSSADYPGYDPSFNDVSGIYTAAFNQYLRQELKVKNDQEYKILSESVNTSWNYTKATNKFLNMSLAIQDVLKKNNHLKIFAANGYFDMVTPFTSLDYTVNHLAIAPVLQKNITLRYYDAGHMVYLYETSLMKLKNDLDNWIKTL